MKLRLTRLAMATGFAFTLLLATASCSDRKNVV
jgi:hypothetical protein